MEFCDKCENMVVPMQMDDGRLTKVCKACTSHKDGYPVEEEPILIHERYYRTKPAESTRPNYDFTKDPTTPVIAIKCPSKECSKPKDEQDKVYFIRYDEQNLKYFYTCAYCHYHWTNAM